MTDSQPALQESRKAGMLANNVVRMLSNASLPDYSYYGGAESLAEGRPPRRTVIASPNGKDDGVSRFGPPQDPSDFLWLMTEEPHRSRRMAIMKAHPEVCLLCMMCKLILIAARIVKVTKLMGHEPLTKWVVLGVVLAQLMTAVLLRHYSPTSWWFIFCAYAIGGTLNHNLFLAIHEITHNLAFKGIRANKALAIMANLPIGVPYCATFKVRYCRGITVLRHD